MTLKYATTVAGLSLALIGCATVPSGEPGAPLVDYHQHLVSAPFAALVSFPPRDGAALMRELDEAGIDRAVVLSVGYSFSDDRRGLEDADRLTREENDWTSQQVAQNAPRLIGFCSANPLRESALTELERCLGLPGMRGIKLHLGNSGVTLRNPAHLARMQQVFVIAERRSAPVLLHMRARGGENYGAPDARLLLEQVVSKAPEVELIVAHLGGAGPGYPAQNDEVMAEFASLLENDPPAFRNVYFDVATNVIAETTPEDGALVADRLRRVGIGRVLYGSDLSAPGGSIAAGWDIFRARVPLSAAEFARIARNRPRFAR